MNPDFGIEIEFEADVNDWKKIFLSLRESIPNLVSDLFASTPDTECPIDYEYCWTLTADSSSYTCLELISPILGSTPNLQVLKTLETANLIKFTKNCGIHIHVNISTFDLYQIKNVFKAWEFAEKFFRSITAKERSNNIYCLSPIIKFDIDEARNLNQLAYIYGDSRDFSLNAKSLISTQTLEFRLFESTSDQEKISNWINQTLAFVKKATDKNADFSNIVPSMLSVDDVKNLLEL